MKTEKQLLKYLLRFGLPFVIAGSIIYFALGPQAITTLLYKICLVVVFYALAELVWAVGYRVSFRHLEERLGSDPQVIQGVFIMRGFLYGAFILAGTLGL
jgi:hypothetical protein